MYKYFPYKEMDHHHILLYGFHFTFLFIFALAVIRDLIFQHPFNAAINFSAFALSAISYYLLHFKSTSTLSSYLVLIIAVIPLYILIYFNHFGNMVIVYVLLLPIVSFFLLPFKKALITNFLMYILLISMLYYISIIQPDAPILNNTLALINIALASILIMLFGIFYHLAIESTLSKLIHSNRQKDILLKEVHHRVKNNLNVTASMLGLQAIHEPAEIKSHILKGKSRIEAIATVHEMLYKQNSFDEISFYDYIIRFEKLLSKAYGGNKKYILKLNVDKDLTLSLDMMVQFGLLLNELLTNTIKYAKNDAGLQLDIMLIPTEDGYLFIYQDNGETPIDIDTLLNKKGLGMKLIDLSSKQLEGKLTITYNNGLIYTLRIKHV
jgi:two-component sensor histidine kinase